MSEKMTLEEIEAISANATPGPWQVRDDGQSYMMPIIDAPSVGRGYWASIATATQRDPHPQHGGGVSIQTATANGYLMASAPRLLEIAQEMRAEIELLRECRDVVLEYAACAGKRDDTSLTRCAKKVREFDRHQKVST